MLAGGTRIVVVMVGLPARGKTYISYKVSRYLAWLGVNCRVFNVGEYRRKLIGAKMDHTFFDPRNAVATEQRLACATHALADMLQWFEAVHNGVAIYDATNSTRARRKMILDECTRFGVEVMFCESWCDDDDLITANIREVKRTSPDYKGAKDIDAVMDDFRQRIEHYREVYEPVGGDGTRPMAKGRYPLPPTAPTIAEYDEQQVSYVRKINVGSQIVINRIASYLESRIVYFVMNIHIAPRSVLFSRHGESLYNLDQRLGGDPSLSPNGRKYAEALPGLISKLLGDQPLTIWTSTLKRTSETTAGLPYKKMQWKALDELDAGLCDGLTYEDVERAYPEEYAMRDENKFEFRYRGGESYRDVVLRLEPVIMELERQQNIMIVSHQAVLRCIYAYFLDIGPEELPYLKIPLHTVMKLTWTAYGCDVQMYKIDIDAVDTHRAKPKAHRRTARRGDSSPASSRPMSARSPALGTPAVASPRPRRGVAASEPPADDGVPSSLEAPLPTPPGATASPLAQHDAAPALVPDVPVPQQPARPERPVPAEPPCIKGVKSSLSVEGGHDQCPCDGHHPGHVWPSQISPGGSRASSRAPSPPPPLPGLGAAKERLASRPPGRSNPRNGSPVYLSAGDFATTFEMHRLAGAGSRSSPTLSDVGKQQQHLREQQYQREQRPPLLGNQKIDELHVAGHGNVDVVSTTPTISLRYSANLPEELRKKTDALKNELVGIETEDSASDDSAAAGGCPK
ncbi:Fructose-2,6-bisphosphatase [Coemansia javaensis]|uniref:fructose-2,6-bisphosphate 2-phosphatase n=1 Tax=Coemansia javaensis TaxID=2761396 RepID=A0A9W8HF16_9FUNG|nr:Fructose-2,6-bisphosphatase [Coemansia javaensis]